MFSCCMYSTKPSFSAYRPYGTFSEYAGSVQSSPSRTTFFLRESRWNRPSCSEIPQYQEESSLNVSPSHAGLSPTFHDETFVRRINSGGTKFTQQVITNRNTHGIQTALIQAQFTNAGSIAISRWLEINRYPLSDSQIFQTRIRPAASVVLAESSAPHKMSTQLVCCLHHRPYGHFLPGYVVHDETRGFSSQQN